MTDKQNDRRSAPRVQASLHLHLVYDDLDQLVEHYASNISEGGLFIETDQPLQLGTFVVLKISIVHQELQYIDAIGEVVRTVKSGGAGTPGGMGVRFKQMSEDSRRFIRDFVLSRIDKSSGEKLPDVSEKPAPEKSSQTKNRPQKKKLGRFSVKKK